MTIRVDNVSAESAAVPVRLRLGEDVCGVSASEHRLFFVGQLISLIGNWINSTAEGWLVHQDIRRPLLLRKLRCHTARRAESSPSRQLTRESYTSKRYETSTSPPDFANHREV